MNHAALRTLTTGVAPAFNHDASWNLFRRDGGIFREPGSFGSPSYLRIQAISANLRLAAMERASIAAAGDRDALVGLALIYNTASDNIGEAPQIFLANCCAASIQNDDIRLLANFDSARVLGRVRGGTLRVWETPDGLHFEADPPACGWSDDLCVSVLRGDVTGSGAAVLPITFTYDRVRGERVKVISRARVVAPGTAAFPRFRKSSLTLQQPGKRSLAARQAT